MQQNFFELDESYVGANVLDPNSFYTSFDESEVNDLPVDQDLSGTHEDGLAASTEAFTLALTLMNYRDKIVAQRGLGVMEVTSIESHVPGLLTRQAPNKFTYEKSDVNMQWSLEAIDGKIGELLKAAALAFEKIITWIIEKVKDIGERLRNGRMKNLIERFNTLKAKKITVITPSEIRRILGDDVYEQQIIAKLNLDNVNAQLKSDISAEDLNALKTGATITDLLNILSKKKAIVPKEFGNFKRIAALTHEVTNDLSKAKSTLFVAGVMFEPTRPDEPRLTKSIVNDGMNTSQYGNENTLASIVMLEKIDDGELRALLQFFGTAESIIKDIERETKAFMSKVKTESPDQVKAYKAQREQMYSFLRGVQENVNHINKCLFLEAVVLNLVNSIIVSHTKQNVYNLKGQTNG